jgi:hypothetical protein
MAFAPNGRARLLLSPPKDGLLTTRQASLNAADRLVAPSNEASDAGLRPDPFPDRAASLLPGLLAATRTGLTPAGDDELMLDHDLHFVLQLWAHPGQVVRLSGRNPSAGHPHHIMYPARSQPASRTKVRMGIRGHHTTPRRAHGPPTTPLRPGKRQECTNQHALDIQHPTQVRRAAVSGLSVARVHRRTFWCVSSEPASLAVSALGWLATGLSPRKGQEKAVTSRRSEGAADPSRDERGRPAPRFR